MKKIFTFIFCALWALSSWGGEVSVTIPESTSETTTNFPFCLTSYGTISQQIFLASELGGETNKGTLQSIAFYYSSSGPTSCPATIYIKETDLTSLSCFVDPGTFSKSYNTITMTRNSWFVFNDISFSWSGKNNLLITIIDSDLNNKPTSSAWNKCNGYATGSNRGVYKAYNYDEGPVPTGNDIIGVSGTVSKTIAQAKFTIDASGSTTPSISTSTGTLNFGSYYPEAETASQTFNVTASNLTDNITLSTTATGVTITPNVIAKDDADLAGDGVEVTVTLGQNYAFAGGTKLSVSSEGASTKEITLSATKIVDANFSTKALSMISSDGYYIVDGKVTISSMNTSEKSMLIQSVTTKNANYAIVEGRDAFAVGGKFSGLKGKYKDGVFTIFSYSSYEGLPTSSVIVEENADNSEVLAEEEENVNVTLNRTAFSKNMFNTFCVPFNISKTLVETKFADCDIITLASSAYSNGVISLTFEECDHMEAGKPYLINPNNQDISFLFNGCNIQNVASGSVETELVDFIGIVNPTYLPQSKEILFMGQNNELFWPTEAGTLKGMRCYFKVNFEGTPEGSAIAGSPVRMSIINSDGTTTDLPTMWAESNSPMIMYKNQLFVIKDNKLISISGQTIQ